MNQPPRDWDKELADIDKAIEKQGTGVAGEGATRGPVVAPPPAAPARSAVALTWFWTLLALGLAIALAAWPFERACGLRLSFWLGAIGLTTLAAFLGAITSWTSRRGFAHLLSLLVLVWAVAVAASEVLPRIGYARERRTWLCPDAAPAPTAPAPSGPPAGAPAPGGQRPTTQPPANPAPTVN